MTSIEDLYSLYYKDVYAFLLSLSKDTHIAEDVTQETFLKVMRNIGKFKGDCDIRVWMFQIAKNTFFTYAEKKRKELADTIEDVADEIAGDVNIVEQLDDRETAMEIHRILHTLEDPYKEVFHLRTFGELSFSNIAQIYGKTESWARVTYHRAKNMIREKMEEML